MHVWMASVFKEHMLPCLLPPRPSLCVRRTSFDQALSCDSSSGQHLSAYVCVWPVCKYMHLCKRPVCLCVVWAMASAH